MNYTQIDAEFSVAPQVQPEELAQLKEAGFKAIICARPDNEDPGQPDFSAIAAEAARLGLEVAHIPVSGAPNNEAIALFNKTMDAFPRPVFAYCRSGNRARILYATYLNRG